MSAPTDLPVTPVEGFYDHHPAQKALDAILRGQQKGWSERRIIRRAKRVLLTPEKAPGWVSI